MSLEAVGVEEAHVVGGDHRQAAFGGGVQGEIVERGFALEAAAGEFQMDAVVEMSLPVGQRLHREIGAVAGEQLPGLAVAAGDGEQPGVGLLQPLRPHHHAVVALAFHPRAAEQPRQRQVAAAVAAEQGELPGRLVALGDADVGACDGLDARALAGLVELDQGEEVVAVGHRHRRLPLRHAAADEFRDADRRIGERILAVQVEMDEAGGHRRTADHSPAG